MKNIKLFESFLLEYLNTDDIYKKYYTNIHFDDYQDIIESDPTFKPLKKQKGIYTNWLLDLYRADNLPLEDLYKATEYLTIYQKFKHLIKADFKTLKSLSDLYVLVEPFEEKEEAVFSNDEERKLSGQFKEVFKNSKFRIIIPLTLEASKYFGKGTQWCTVNTDQFKYYTENQTEDITQNNLYILLNTDPSERLQFHFEENQFMDVRDEKIDLSKFFEENKDVYKFFDKHFPVLRCVNPYLFYKKGSRLYDKEKEAIIFVDGILSNLRRVKKLSYPNMEFFIDKNNIVYMEKVSTGHHIWCGFPNFWNVVEEKYNMGYHEIKGLMKYCIEKNFGITDLTPAGKNMMLYHLDKYEEV